MSMKWPDYLAMIRHDVSVYNVLKSEKMNDPLYREFLLCFDEDYTSHRTVELAEALRHKFSLTMSDQDTPLVDSESKNAEIVGSKLKNNLELPDIIFVSPYKRTWGTFEGLKRGWPELENVEFFKEERIREQEHGLVLLCNDLKIFQALHPEQKKLRDMEGPYRYQYPQGENVPMVRERNRSWIGTVSREFRGKKVLAISHHLNILATMAQLERWDAEKFIQVDTEEKPINCGVTLYKGHPELGEEGKLVLEYYNKKFF